VLRTFWHSEYFRTSQRHEGVRLTDVENELFDLYDGIAATPGFFIDMDLEPGDIQLLSNHTVIHSRTDYVDYAEPDRKRHLLRLWITLRAAGS
jgi:alpha-ketoglutarate-dependent taurine dioxygenase